MTYPPSAASAQQEAVFRSDLEHGVGGLRSNSGLLRSKRLSRFIWYHLGVCLTEQRRFECRESEDADDHRSRHR